MVDGKQAQSLFCGCQMSPVWDTLVAHANDEGFAAMGFFAWHREQVNSWQRVLRLDSYQLLWVAFLKGLIVGALLFWLFS